MILSGGMKKARWEKAGWTGRMVPGEEGELSQRGTPANVNKELAMSLDVLKEPFKLSRMGTNTPEALKVNVMFLGTAK